MENELNPVNQNLTAPTPPSAPLPPNSNSNSSFGYVVLLLVLLAALVVGGYFYFKGQPGQSTGQPLPEASEEPTPAVSPSPGEGTESALPEEPLSPGSSVDDIIKDINSTNLESFDADFTDLSKDVNGL